MPHNPPPPCDGAPAQKEINTLYYTDEVHTVEVPRTPRESAVRGKCRVYYSRTPLKPVVCGGAREAGKGGGSLYKYSWRAWCNVI